MPIRGFVSPTSGNLNTLVSGSVVTGAAIFLGRTNRKVVSLSARVQLTAATSTLTIATKWQVSVDGTNFVDITNGPQNAASVVVTTGTAAIVTKIIPPPDAIYGYPYARLALVTGVTTGAAGDLYVIDYAYRQLTASDNAA